MNGHFYSVRTFTFSCISSIGEITSIFLPWCGMLFDVFHENEPLIFPISKAPYQNSFSTFTFFVTFSTWNCFPSNSRETAPLLSQSAAVILLLAFPCRKQTTSLSSRSLFHEIDLNKTSPCTRDLFLPTKTSGSFSPPIKTPQRTSSLFLTISWRGYHRSSRVIGLFFPRTSFSTLPLPLPRTPPHPLGGVSFPSPLSPRLTENSWVLVYIWKPGTADMADTQR